MCVPSQAWSEKQSLEMVEKRQPLFLYFNSKYITNEPHFLLRLLKYEQYIFIVN
jgi:hypothetical protein